MHQNNHATPKSKNQFNNSKGYRGLFIAVRKTGRELQLGAASIASLVYLVDQYFE